MLNFVLSQVIIVHDLGSAVWDTMQIQESEFNLSSYIYPMYLIIICRLT